MKITDRKIITALMGGKEIKRESYGVCTVRLLDQHSLYSGFETYYANAGSYDDGGLCFGDLIAGDWEVVK